MLKTIFVVVLIAAGCCLLVAALAFGAINVARVVYHAQQRKPKHKYKHK